MALDLFKGETSSNYTRHGEGRFSRFAGSALFHLEKIAISEAQAIKDQAIASAARTLGLVTLVGGALALGYNHIKSTKKR